MKHTVKTKSKTTTRILALVIAMITALSAMSAVTLTASAANETITYNCYFDLWGHSEGRVRIKVNGTNGSTDYHNAGTVGHGAPNTFTFTDRNVGEIQSVTIKTDVPSTIEGWGQNSVCEFIYFCDYAPISITVNGVKIYCAQEITDTSEYTFSVTDNVYRVTVKTADVKNAGTDLNVYATLNGKDGKKSNTINMSNDGSDTTPTGNYLNAFERGHQQTTYIRAPFDEVQSITLELSGALIAAKGWKCESITIEQVNGNTDPGVKTVNVNQWFATEKDNYTRTINIPN